MIIPMTITVRRQQRYDHRRRNLVCHTGDVTIATDLGVPRGTARGWLSRAPEVVVSLEVTPLSELELQHEILTLRRRVQKLAALLQLVLAVLRVSGFTLAHERLPDGRAKVRILRAVDRAREYIPLRALLRVIRLSPSRFHAWRRQDACALDDQASCPRASPHRLTPSEVQVIKDMVTSPEYRTCRPVRWPSSHSGSARSGRPPRRGTAWCGRVGGVARGCACTRPNRRLGCARRALTRCGTSTPPSSVCSTGPAPICTR